MPKNTRRVTFTRTISYTTTVDVPGYPDESDANILTLSGGAAGNTGTLSLGELLAGSASANGAINRGNWSVTGTSTNVEGYISRPQNTALAVGDRIASTTPPSGYSGAIAKLFVVTVAGTTANSATEPNWNLTDGGTTTDGTVTYRTIPKFPSLLTFAVSTAYTVGQIVRPSSGSLREYLVTTAGTSAGSAPTWTNADTAGTTLTSNTAVFTALINVKTYANLTAYALGDVVKPSAASTQEYLVTVAGSTDAASAAPNLGSIDATTTIGTVTFKRKV